jgi:hypothetical protein
LYVRHFAIRSKRTGKIALSLQHCSDKSMRHNEARCYSAFPGPALAIGSAIRLRALVELEIGGGCLAPLRHRPGAEWPGAARTGHCSRGPPRTRARTPSSPRRCARRQARADRNRATSRDRRELTSTLTRIGTSSSQAHFDGLFARVSIVSIVFQTPQETDSWVATNLSPSAIASDRRRRLR